MAPGQGNEYRKTVTYLDYIAQLSDVSGIKVDTFAAAVEGTFKPHGFLRFHGMQRI